MKLVFKKQISEQLDSLIADALEKKQQIEYIELSLVEFETLRYEVGQLYPRHGNPNITTYRHLPIRIVYGERLGG